MNTKYNSPECVELELMLDGTVLAASTATLGTLEDNTVYNETF